MLETHNIFVAVSPVFYFSKIFGFTSLNITQKNRNLTKSGIIWPIIFHLLFITISYYDLRELLGNNFDEIYHIMEIVKMNVMILNIVNAVIMDLWYRKNVSIIDII